MIRRKYEKRAISGELEMRIRRRQKQTVAMVTCAMTTRGHSEAGANVTYKNQGNSCTVHTQSLTEERLVAITTGFSL